MLKSQFVNTLTELALVIRNEAGNPEESGLHFYDELKSCYNSIEYGGSELFDLGNLSALLSVVNSEVSEDHMDEDDNYYINANNYHDISRTLNHLLADQVFMYAKGTSGIMTEDLFYRTLDDQLGYGSLGASGMSIFFPGPELMTSANGYFSKLDPVIDRLPDNDKRKAFLKDYEAVVAYYELILYSATTINHQINDEDGFYVPALVVNGTDEPDTSRYLMLEFSPAEGHELTSFYYMNTDTAPVKVEPKDLTREITVMTALVVRQMFASDIYVPISHTSFTISADNADSISLDYMDIADIADIGDTDGDGMVYDTAITITDIYNYQIHVTDRIHIKKVRIKPAISTGEELEPELVYRGQTLRPGIDYIWQKEGFWNEETHTIETPDFVEPGE